TGRLADGWIPSLAYAPPSELAGMTQIIDAAAQAAGRDPAAIRRMYNVNGRFAAAEQGFLHGPSRLWVEQLAELALEHGMSVFVLGPGADAEGDLRRFAEEVAPGVRAAVEQARAAGRPSPQTPSGVAPRAVQAVAPAEAPARADRAPHSAALDEATRPHRAHSAAAPLTAIGRQSQATLLQVHEHLRQELEQIRAAAEEVATGMLEPAQARSLIYQMTIRQNEWTLGTFCAQYCRVVSIHHTIEDTHLFPQLAQAEASLEPVLERLHAEHEVIAAQLERFDQALIAMMTAQEQIVEVRRVADDLADMLLSHLTYEEDELLGPLGRLEILV
ncbi:MAG TPA: hemerythrin domain-containing protein, partial [Roseiflexaceae bacterium]